MRKNKTNKQVVIMSVIATITIVNTILIGILYFIQNNQFWAANFMIENHTKRIIDLENTVKKLDN